jgi:hypothetical protein
MMRGGGAVLRAASLGFAPLLIAAGLTRAIAAMDGAAFADVVLLPPRDTPFLRDLFAALAFAAGAFGVFFAPGLLAMRAFRLRVPTAPSTAFSALALSLALLSFAWVIAMALFPGEGGRVCLLLTAASVDAALLLIAVKTASGAAALPRPVEGEWRDSLLLPSAAIAATIFVGLLLMPGKLRVEAMEGDATEVMGFGLSLFERGVPEWDLETGAWGFYPTFVFVAYPVFFSLALGGISEAAVRLPGLLFLGVMMLAAYDLARRSFGGAHLSPLRTLAPILAAGFLSLLAGAYYAGYHPFHGDLGCSPLEEWIVAGFAMSAVVLVRDGLPRTAALAALLSILTFPSGLMLVGLFGIAGLAFGNNGVRRSVLRTGMWLGIYLAAYAVALVAFTTARGTFTPMIAEWRAKYFTGRASFGQEHPARIVRAAGWVTLLCGGLSIFGLLLAWIRGDRTARWIAAAALAWIGFFLLSPNKNIHYFMPVALLPAVAALRSGAPSWLLTASTIVCIAMVWPKRVPPYTADREFSERTLFLEENIRDAVDDSMVLYNLAKPLWKWQPGDGWTLGHHTWVVYARFPSAPSPTPQFYVGRGAPPRGDLSEITRIPVGNGVEATWWSPRGREDWREWRDLSYPLKRDLSRFNFEMEARPEPRTRP